MICIELQQAIFSQRQPISTRPHLSASAPPVLARHWQTGIAQSRARDLPGVRRRRAARRGARAVGFGRRAQADADT
jgi:hypothetical protein